MIVPIKIPPGAYRNGTEYQARGRWRDVNLVRWHEGAMQPVGGWAGLGPTDSSSVSGSPRGGLSWTDNSDNVWTLFGTPFANVYVFDSSYAMSEISAAMTSGTEDAGGIPWLPDGLASTWSWDTFGEIPIGCLDADGKIWEWDLNTGNNLTQVTNSPTGCSAIVVTQERFIMALDAGSEKGRVEWCDRGDRTVWAAAATNQAGGFNLNTSGNLRLGLQLRGETLLVSSSDAWSANYVGYPDVYSFGRVGKECGVSGRLAGVSIGDRAFWLGTNTFFSYTSGHVEELPCDVWDYFFTDLDSAQVSKTMAWHNADFNEVWWHYQSTGSADDIDKYIAYNYRHGFWHYGTILARTVVGAGGGGVTDRATGMFPQEEATISDKGFDTGTGWTLGTNWAIAGGYAAQTPPTASDLTQALTQDFVVGAKYVVSIEGVINYTAGTLTVDIGGTSGTVTSGGTTSLLLTAGSVNPTLTLSADGTFDGDIGSVSIKTPHLRQMETGVLHEMAMGTGASVYAESGPIDAGNGERRVHVTSLIPDEQDAGELTYTFKTKEYPNAAETSHAAVASTNPTSIRFSGRQFKMRVAPTSVADWRLGVPRLELKPGGKR